MGMVKTVLGVNHQGLRDWFFQRISAVIMAIYIIGLMVFFIKHPNLAFYEWQGLFIQPWMKIATLLFVLSLLFHSWVGMWTIYTDYVTCYIARLILQTVTLLALIAFFLSALLILWGI
jgi:succinate dehydrogenase / fumarate reductase membrane anchor subunit